MDLGIVSQQYDMSLRATRFRVCDYDSGRTTYVTVFDWELANPMHTDEYLKTIYSAAEDAFSRPQESA